MKSIVEKRRRKSKGVRGPEYARLKRKRCLRLASINAPDSKDTWRLLRLFTFFHRTEMHHYRIGRDWKGRGAGGRVRERERERTSMRERRGVLMLEYFIRDTR
jgi:hypothetical protein